MKPDIPNKTFFLNRKIWENDDDGDGDDDDDNDDGDAPQCIGARAALGGRIR